MTALTILTLLAVLALATVVALTGALGAVLFGAGASLIVPEVLVQRRRR